MKIPKIAWALGRALGLGSAAVYVAALNAAPVNAHCVTCSGSSGGNLGCTSVSQGGGSGCSIQFDPATQTLRCSTFGMCTS